MRKLIMVFLLFFITGCGKHEIEDYKIVSGIAIDFQDNNYNLTLEVVKGEKTDADFIEKLKTFISCVWSFLVANCVNLLKIYFKFI